MIEIPESATLARQLEESVTGKTVVSLVQGASPHKFAFFSDYPVTYEVMLLDKPIENAHAAGGHVVLENADSRLTFGDGIAFRYCASGEKVPDKHQLLLQFDDGSALLCTVRMYGAMWAAPKGMEDNFYMQVAYEKPNPLTAAFTAEYFGGIWNEAKPTLSAKALLATEQRIPGLGNGCAQDILFNAGIHPKRKMSTLGDAEKKTLFSSIKDTLARMTEGGGRDTEKDIYGNAGGYKTILSSKTAKEPCPVCGDAIIRQAFLGGNIYFCPTCQPLN